jgi:predicted outer membrane repeat protein
MAGSNRRFKLAAFVLPLLFMVMSGLARANTITVDTLSGASIPTHCTLQDAVTAANTQAPLHGCVAGSGNNDLIQFAVTGTIFISAQLEVKTPETLQISGPQVGGITIDGTVVPTPTDGGIISTDAGTTLALNNLTFANGTASGDGGAIFALGLGLEVSNSTFTKNSAAYGGAIYTDDSGPTNKITITNSTFSGNSASVNGGAIFNQENLTLINDTISGNSAATAGSGLSIIAGGTTTFRGVIVANGSGGAGVKNCDASITTDDHYNISDDATCGFGGFYGKNTNPQLAAGLAANGGPTDTIALNQNSPAINYIPLANCLDASGDPLTLDQRLFPRPSPVNPNTCSSGAYEFDATPIAVVPKSLRLQLAKSATAGQDTLNSAFTFIDFGPPLPPNCNAGNNALNGIELEFLGGTCNDLPTNGLDILIHFNLHTVGHVTYGTSNGPNGTATMVQLPTPAGACGEWTMNLEVNGLNLDSEGLGGPGPGPFALIIADGNGNEGCFDIDNAIAGTQIPVQRTVRRGVRRGAKR